MQHPRPRPLCVVLCVCVLAAVTPAAAQGDRSEDRTEYPAWLARAVFDFSVGEIRYPFSSRHLEEGFDAESVATPKLAARLTLGHRFNDYLSAHLTYMRPARWVRYRNVNGDRSGHSVWMNIVGASAQGRLPIGRMSLYGEGGIGVITRHGVQIGESIVIDDLVYATPLVGAGAEVRLNDRWGLQLGATYLHGHAREGHPYTMFFSSGVSYRVQPQRARAAASPDPKREVIFHERLVQLGLATNGVGGALNRFVDPVFWEGDAVVQIGGSIEYLHNVFHTKSLFSLDMGTSLAYGHSRDRGDDFLTFSLYPVMRLTPLRTQAADVYVSYSVGGPTAISKFIIDGHETGRHFTFRDAIGFGAYLGPGKHMNAEVKIVHYSNGNLLPRNSGIQVPFTFNL
jgi:hypothetical protein